MRFNKEVTVKCLYIIIWRRFSLDVFLKYSFNLKFSSTSDFYYEQWEPLNRYFNFLSLKTIANNKIFSYIYNIEDFPMRTIECLTVYINNCWCYAGKIRFSIYISLEIYNIISTKVALSCVNSVSWSIWYIYNTLWSLS